MKHILPFLGMIALLTACNEHRPNVLGPQEYQGATGAAATVKEVGKAIQVEKPAESRILAAATRQLDLSLQSDQVDPESQGKPLTTAKAIKDDAQAAAGAAEKAEEDNRKGIKTEQETPWYAKVLTWGGWATLAGIGLWAGRLLGIPGVNLVADPLVRLLGKPWLAKIEEKASQAQGTIGTLTATVEGSMAGRAGLQLLDQILGNRIAPELSRMTGGQANTVEDLFKWLSKSHVNDSEHTDLVAVAGMVDQIKNQMDTVGGIPKTVVAALNAVQTKIPPTTPPSV